jgi:hypothetical protein
MQRGDKIVCLSGYKLLDRFGNAVSHLRTPRAKCGERRLSGSTRVP